MVNTAAAGPAPTHLAEDQVEREEQRREREPREGQRNEEVDELQRGGGGAVRSLSGPAHRSPTMPPPHLQHEAPLARQAVRRAQEAREVVQVVEQREERAVQPAAALLDELREGPRSVRLGALVEKEGGGGARRRSIAKQHAEQKPAPALLLTAPMMYLRIHWRCFLATISKHRMRSSARYMFATKGPRSCTGAGEEERRLAEECRGEDGVCTPAFPPTLTAISSIVK